MDFTNYPKRNKWYNGANGNKICIVIENEPYMIKFPAQANRNENLSYSNSCISEYLGCHIFNMLGIPAQQTELGTYFVNGNCKIVVACKDFTSPGIVLQDFASMKNQAVEASRNGYGTDLDEVLFTIQEQTAFDPRELLVHFWNMFIADALIGNWDRHNGNWGFLYNTYTDAVQLAPIFDCGSSLYPQADDSLMIKILNNPAEIGNRVFQYPTSAFQQNGRKINYFDFISSLQNAECNAALRRITPKINMVKIFHLIDSTPYISSIHKDFLKRMIQMRKTKILDFSLKKLKEKEGPEQPDNRLLSL